MWNNARILNRLAATLLAAVGAAVLYTGVHWLTHRPAFVLHSIRVVSMNHGELRHVSVAAIRATALPQVHGNFFSVNLASVRQAFESVAWVRKASVRRVFPNRLVVEVEEQQPLALWSDGRVVNQQGELFAANLAELESDGGALPQFSGPEGSEHDVTDRYRQLVDWFAPLHLTPEEVTLSARYAWTVALDNGTEQGLLVELGREHDTSTLASRVARLVFAYPVLTSQWPHLTMVDLRYPNGFALKAEGLRLAGERPVRPIRTAAPSRKNTPARA